MADKSRVWFAVKDGDDVRCVVEDVDLPGDWHVTTPTRQWFRVLSLEISALPEYQPSRTDLYGNCDRVGPPCEPGRPCAKCHRAARQVWERAHASQGPLFGGAPR